MTVFVSPHFDDAIGSCGCLINNLVQCGETVEILTVFAGRHGCQNVSNFSKTLLKLWQLVDGIIERAEENVISCSRIGAVVRNLPFIEAIYRNCNGRWLYPNANDIFGKIQPEDKLLPNGIANTINSIYSDNIRFYFPGGRGSHVDHLLVKFAGEILASRGYNIILYTDFSYEGQINSIFPLEEETLYFGRDDLKAKIFAMDAYKSQLKMLFGSASSSSYFYKENIKGDKVYEQYFNVCKL